MNDFRQGRESHFRNRLDQMIDLRHPLAVLANHVPGKGSRLVWPSAGALSQSLEEMKAWMRRAADLRSEQSYRMMKYQAFGWGFVDGNDCLSFVLHEDTIVLS